MQMYNQSTIKLMQRHLNDYGTYLESCAQVADDMVAQALDIVEGSIGARIMSELTTQIIKFGPQTDKTREFHVTVLMEEVGEVANAVLEDKPWAKIVDELIQVAAVAVRMAGYLDDGKI